MAVQKGSKTVKIEVFWPFRPFSTFFYFFLLACDSHYVGNRSPFFKMHPRDLSKYDVFLFCFFLSAVAAQASRDDIAVAERRSKKGPKTVKIEGFFGLLCNFRVFL